MTLYRRGDTLSPSAQREVLARFVHRYTGEHKPGWVTSEAVTPLQFADDAEWLRNTFFPVRRSDGWPHGKVRHCTSYPTWPTRPDLRKEASGEYVDGRTEYEE